jgi:hypothetical protein
LQFNGFHSLVENHSWVAPLPNAVLNDVGPAALVCNVIVVEEGPLGLGRLLDHLLVEPLRVLVGRVDEAAELNRDPPEKG